ncbi:HGxxPAAW family protein [Arthrobacter russicus]|jgi:hypothetical protein|uniref:Integral membrane protein n=1 Tax=Arthrobacter russicus TaxID=172040 RepID=A0ABU1JFL3_9MICC|nr:HGxxPAAW family protein [Arthrobacter russicus]MBQ1442549.1 hypothetical protein [Renibacterium sp.]MDN5669567.1 hypothetical protein [Renibacterium salmoninarum]MDR6271234.1 hypothetical protein [Arthrobacter russicus]
MSSKTTTTNASTATEPVQRAVVESHGSSPAAWTTVFVALAGALVCSIAFVFANTPLFIVGLVVMVIGGIIGIVMRKMGFGVGGSRVKQTSGH